jgi:long-chain acyl-CoA synthetase
MARRTLIDFFADATSGSTAEREFLVYDDGYRTWTWTYAELGGAAHAFAARLRDARITAGQAIAVWSENRPEWIAALWGALLEGVVVVPIDYRASAEFLSKVAAIVDAKAILVGDAVDANAIPAQWRTWKLGELFRNASSLPETDIGQRSSVLDSATTAEIIFTSGATADPKGVVLTHKNILANIVPIEREMAKYRKYTIPFRPIRFLNLLPLSHMFGQAMATFVPPMLPGVVVFTRSYAPDDIIRQIKSRRVSVLVCVPKILEVLKDHVLRVAPEAGEPPPPDAHWAKRWWRYRRIHRMFGFKFWAMVVGAAPLDPELEAFWGRLGFLVVQGYGLTETAPIVTLNHPLRAKRGAVGKPIAGVELKIAADGEVLVRGENVTTGYFNAPEATREAFADGWFHTGDIGELDAEGRLLIRGRKKEMIVTPEGLNVFPEDVERAINVIPGVRDSAVVGVPIGTEERVHAVLILEPGIEADAVVRQANATLDDHQKIRRALLWPEPELPRTDGTRKLKRAAIREWVMSGGAPRLVQRGTDALAALVAKYAGRENLSPQTTLQELGLSSLDRVELMVALEDTFQTRIDEGSFASAQDLGQLRTLVEHASSSAGSPVEPVDFPAWTRSVVARAVRRVNLATWILPLARVFAWTRIEGLEHLRDLEGPVIFAANHQSFMDGPVIMASLPARWRYRVSPAMGKEMFAAHFFPAQHGRLSWMTNSLNYYLAVLLFNAFPLPQREAGARQTLRYIGELLADKHSLLIFPEGRRSETGAIDAFRPGLGMIASKLGAKVVPVRIDGLQHVLGVGSHMARPGRVRVKFGGPLRLIGEDYEALAKTVESAVRAL